MKLNRKKVEHIMGRNKMSQRELADAMDVAPSFVSKCLNNCANNRKITIGKIAEALKVDVEEIID